MSVIGVIGNFGVARSATTRQGRLNARRPGVSDRLMREMEEQLEAGHDIAAGLFAIAAQLSSVSVQLKYLGVGDAATTMGAMEYLAVKVEEAGSSIANAIERVELER